MMFRKSTFYALAFVVFTTFGGVSLWGELNYSSKTTRADANEESVADAPDAEPASVVFLTDVQSALAQSSRENKPALIFFMADDCKYSRQMMTDAFQNGEVERLSQSFVCVAVDVNDPANAEICREFGIAASPTVQFVTSYGAPIQRVPSAQSSERLIALMKSALATVKWRVARMPGADSVWR